MAGTAKAQLSFQPLGDRAILLEVGADTSAQTVARVRSLGDYLAQLRLPGILDLVPALRTIGIHYDPEQWRDESATRPPYDVLVEQSPLTDCIVPANVPNLFLVPSSVDLTPSTLKRVDHSFQ